MREGKWWLVQLKCVCRLVQGWYRMLEVWRISQSTPRQLFRFWEPRRHSSGESFTLSDVTSVIRTSCWHCLKSQMVGVVDLFFHSGRSACYFMSWKRCSHSLKSGHPVWCFWCCEGHLSFQSLTSAFWTGFLSDSCSLLAVVTMTINLPG